MIDSYSFTDLTLESCYWGGFIAADGCMSDNRNLVQIHLSSKDQRHLLKLKNFLQTDRPIENRGRSIQLRFCDSKIKSDLNTIFNITPRKAQTLRPPNLIDIDMKLAYIAGYIDGDGWVGIQKTRGYSYPCIGVCGNKDVIEWIYETFQQFVYKKNIKARPKSSKSHDDNFRTYAVWGSGARDIIDRIGSLNLPLLQRKWGRVS